MFPNDFFKNFLMFLLSFSDDFAYLVSNKFVNATNPTTCYHKKTMQTYVTFYKKGLKSNWINFRYKVDGMPCPKRYKSRSSCRKGLRFYIDDQLVLHSFSKFTWSFLKYIVTQLCFYLFGLCRLFIRSVVFSRGAMGGAE